MTNLKTQEQLRNLMTGIEPIRRTNRRAGESEYYFLRPVADSEYDDEQIDVPDGVDPIAFRDAGYQVPTTSGTFGASGFGTNSGQQSGFGLNAYNAGMGTTTGWASTSQSTGTSATNTGFGSNNMFDSDITPSSKEGEDVNGWYNVETFSVPQQYNRTQSEFFNPKYIEYQTPLNNNDGIGTVFDVMSNNYFDMREDNTIGNDNYFHCKANFDAARLGPKEDQIAAKLGEMKEQIDFWINSWCF